MGAQNPAHFGRTEAGPPWAYSIPKWMPRDSEYVGAQINPYKSHSYKIVAHKHKMGAQRPAHHGRTEAGSA